MSTPNIQLVGMNLLQTRLAALPRHIQRKIIPPALRKGASVVLREARRLAPVLSGQYKRSLGATLKNSKSGTGAYMRIGPRRGYSIRRGQGERRAVKFVGPSGRTRTRFARGGWHTANPQFYGWFVEFGRDGKRGKMAPRAPLSKAIQSTQTQTITAVASSLRLSFSNNLASW